MIPWITQWRLCSYVSRRKSPWLQPLIDNIVNIYEVLQSNCWFLCLENIKKHLKMWPSWVELPHLTLSVMWCEHCKHTLQCQCWDNKLCNPICVSVSTKVRPHFGSNWDRNISCPLVLWPRLSGHIIVIHQWFKDIVPPCLWFCELEWLSKRQCTCPLFSALLGLNVLINMVSLLLEIIFNDWVCQATVVENFRSKV